MQPADAADGETVKDTVVEAQGNLNDATKQECRITEVVADKGYHAAETLAWRDEREPPHLHPGATATREARWDDKPEGWREAVLREPPACAARKGQAAAAAAERGR